MEKRPWYNLSHKNWSSGNNAVWTYRQKPKALILVQSSPWALKTENETEFLWNFGIHIDMLT